MADPACAQVFGCDRRRFWCPWILGYWVDAVGIVPGPGNSCFGPAKGGVVGFECVAVGTNGGGFLPCSRLRVQGFQPMVFQCRRRLKCEPIPALGF